MAMVFFQSHFVVDRLSGDHTCCDGSFSDSGVKVFLIIYTLSSSRVLFHLL